MIYAKRVSDTEVIIEQGGQTYTMHPDKYRVWCRHQTEFITFTWGDAYPVEQKRTYDPRKQCYVQN